MPLFEYRCGGCHHEYEALVRGESSPTCPECGEAASPSDKLLSAASGRVARGMSLPVTGGCPPLEAGPCSPTCCRIPAGGGG